MANYIIHTTGQKSHALYFSRRRLAVANHTERKNGMWLKVTEGITIPFIGTALGSACVFFMKNQLSRKLQRALTGFAGGVMVAASIWSLLIPAMEQCEDRGKWAFLPAFTGFWLGILFLLLLDKIIPHLHMNAEQTEGPKSKAKKTTMMVLAVTLHNIPDVMYCNKYIIEK